MNLRWEGEINFFEPSGVWNFFLVTLHPTLFTFQVGNTFFSLTVSVLRFLLCCSSIEKSLTVFMRWLTQWKLRNTIMNVWLPASETENSLDFLPIKLGGSAVSISCWKPVRFWEFLILGPYRMPEEASGFCCQWRTETAGAERIQ